MTFFLSLVIVSAFSQEKTEKKKKEEGKQENRRQIEMMINARDFIFEPRTAIPTGMRSVSLTGNRNYIKFQENLIDSYMPFFGQAYSGVAYSNDTGLSFKEKPEKFTVTKNRKTFEISAVVKGESDVFRIFLIVGFDGNASLSISCNNRSPISYQGEILVGNNSDK